MAKKVELAIHQSCGSLGISLANLEDGSGGGYRIVGPKVAKSMEVKTFDLTVEDIDRLISELKHSKKFLKK